jgi:hypothetical protein
VLITSTSSFRAMKETVSRSKDADGALRSKVQASQCSSARMKRATAEGGGESSAQESCESEFITEWPPPAAAVRRVIPSPTKLAKSSNSGSVSDGSSSSSCDDSCVNKDSEADAAVALAKFWRQCGMPLQSARGEKTLSSSSRIALVARSDAGRRFLELRAAKLRRLTASPSPRQAALLHALASALNYLGDIRGALQACSRAAKLAPRKRSYEWLRLKLERFAAARDAAAASWPAACPVGCQFRTVQRLHCSQLTSRQFFQEFSMMRRPVIITGLQITREPWSLDVIEREAAALRVDIKTVRADSCEWAGLELDRSTTVAEFIRGIRSCSDDDVRCNQAGYLFDWSLPQVCSSILSSKLQFVANCLQHCPALASQLIIPRYFARDLLQRLPDGCMYKVSRLQPVPPPPSALSTSAGHLAQPIHRSWWHQLRRACGRVCFEFLDGHAAGQRVGPHRICIRRRRSHHHGTPHRNLQPISSIQLLCFRVPSAGQSGTRRRCRC